MTGGDVKIIFAILILGAWAMPAFADDRVLLTHYEQQLGTGSPNTVLRMLETWRGALAERLHQVLSLPDVPAEVGQAFTECWRLAMDHASSAAQTSLAQEQNALLAAQTSLTQERKVYENAVAAAQELAQGADQAREIAETRLVDVQRLVEQQAGQLTELLQQRDGLQQRADQLADSLEKHKSVAATEREAQVAHLRAIEDRAHAEIDRAREETKSLQAALRQKERDALTLAARLESVVASTRAAENLASEYGARAKALEQQLGRMDGLSAALLAAQKSLHAATQRETALRGKLDDLTLAAKKKPTTGKRKARVASAAS
jgi:DNA repair exonuclease SbcCD ATPase subunit